MNWPASELAALEASLNAAESIACECECDEYPDCRGFCPARCGRMFCYRCDAPGARLCSPCACAEIDAEHAGDAVLIDSRSSSTESAVAAHLGADRSPSSGAAADSSEFAAESPPRIRPPRPASAVELALAELREAIPTVRVPYGAALEFDGLFDDGGPL